MLVIWTLWVSLLLVRRLQPWVSNAQKRLVRSLKVYVRDTGLVHALLGVRNKEELLGHPIVGWSWEGMLIENILSAIFSSIGAWFYRTSAGAEIDLVLELGVKERWAIEIKSSISNPVPSKGFYIGCEDLKATRQIVLYPGTERFRIDSKSEVMSLNQFQQQELRQKKP